jgi:hypothetical protein
MSDLLTVRFPSGAREFRMSDKAPEVGDALTRDGDNWLVEEVHEGDGGSTIVTLRPQPLVDPETEDD